MLWNIKFNYSSVFMINKYFAYSPWAQKANINKLLKWFISHKVKNIKVKSLHLIVQSRTHYKTVVTLEKYPSFITYFAQKLAVEAKTDCFLEKIKLNQSKSMLAIKKVSINKNENVHNLAVTEF